MSHTAGEDSGTSRAASNVQPSPMTGWVGWVAFAGVMMVMAGLFHMVQGLVAIFRDEVYVVSKSGLALSIDYTAWGWIHLLGGALVLGGGLALFVGKTWARVLAVIVAMVSMLINVGFLAAFPIWSSLMIAVDVLIIWAVMVHGEELRRL